MLVSMLIEVMLEDLGCTMVGPATTLAGALELVGVEAIDLAILDMNLKGERAEPVAAALRARGTPFIFATGYGEAGLSPAFHGTPVLPKPFEEASFARVLLEALAGGDPR